MTFFQLFQRQLLFDFNRNFNQKYFENIAAGAPLSKLANLLFNLFGRAPITRLTNNNEGVKGSGSSLRVLISLRFIPGSTLRSFTLA